MADETKLTRLDPSCVGDHSKLTVADEVYFWREYTSGRDYSFGPGNDLISNLKKKPSQSNAYEIRHKRRVITECAKFFSQAINMDWLKEAVIVPIPGSKVFGHADYDDRLHRICAEMATPFKLDYRQLIVQNESTAAAHEGQRPTVEDLLGNYQFDEHAISLAPVPDRIGIMDDVLTAGVHFRAIDTMLRKRFPKAQIVGFFVARRIFPNENEAKNELANEH